MALLDCFDRNNPQMPTRTTRFSQVPLLCAPINMNTNSDPSTQPMEVMYRLLWYPLVLVARDLWLPKSAGAQVPYKMVQHSWPSWPLVSPVPPFMGFSCLEKPMDGGAWQAAVHGVAKSWTRLSDFTFNFHFHTLEKEMATHSSTLAWKSPWMEEPGRLQSMGSLRVGYD